MNKFISLFFLTLIISPRFLFCSTSAEVSYEKGVEYIDKFYDSGSAIQELNKVIFCDNVLPELKARAYFWLANIYLFEGQTEQARKSLSRMFKEKPDPFYDFTSQLSESITKNKALMSFYQEQREKTFGRKLRKKKVEIYSAKPKRQKEPSQDMGKDSAGWEKRIVSFMTSLIYISALVLMIG
ncbi:MAG: hypothetical protein ABII74_06085 [Elusimicrobiota bacterium]